MVDLYHKAAQDGFLDILRDATRRDCDRRDENGLTPTHWAAYHGNLDALRLIISRGGNADKSDYLGNTALHWSACHGHLNCVSYLVTFGANVWKMDNDYHTPLDVAALANYTHVVKYLDTMMAQQRQRNPKTVKRLKERATSDAEKSIKNYDKLHQKAQRKAAKVDKVMARERQKQGITTNGNGVHDFLKDGVKNTNRHSTRRASSNSLHKSQNDILTTDPKPYSAHVTLSSATSRNIISGVAKRIMQKQRSVTSSTTGSDFTIRDTQSNGHKTTRSLSGLKRDESVMYLQNSSSTQNLNRLSHAVSEPELHIEDDQIDGTSDNPISLYDRPGFGSMGFLNRPSTKESMMTLPNTVAGAVTTSEDGSPTISKQSKSAYNNHGSYTDSIGTLGSLPYRMQHLLDQDDDRLPWGADDLSSLDSDSGVSVASPLELFLISNGLTDYIVVLSQQQIDMESLMLCDDKDLKEIGLPMGPRKKILDAIYRRRQALERPGIIIDSIL